MKRGDWSAGEIGGPAALSVSPRLDRGTKLLDVFPADGIPAVESLRDLQADRRVRVTGRKAGMDITWLDDRIAVGGGIWNADNMAAVSRAGITHIIDMQIEFDDTPLAEPHGIVVCWNPVDDDFKPKPPEVFERGVEFALAALKENGAKLFVHCAAGVHRAPMMALALLGVLGWTVEDAMDLIEAKRPAADFANVYVRSVVGFLNGRG
ncbi:MAG: dual specificity protein phosphatase [Candidatus Sulfotelmatobacter sp.]